MKQFQFRLERVQKLRERVRERRRLLHAEALEYQGRVEAQIARLEELRDSERQILRETLSNPEISVDSIIRSRAYDGMLGNFRRNLDRQLDQVRQVVELRRLDLVAAERDVRILEKLEEKLHSRYRESANRVEQAEMDEMAGRARSIRAEILKSAE